MTRKEILDVFADLAQSQGFYGRLLHWLANTDEEEREAYLSDLEAQNFKDSIELILYIES